MRILKITLLTVALLVAGLVVLLFYFRPAPWSGQQRRESIRALRAAKTPEELRKAVTIWGAVITPTNGGWMAIRYRDTHSYRNQSMAIVRDSDDCWFESDRHFCGVLQGTPEKIRRERRHRSENPDLFTNETDSVYFKPGTPSEPYYRLFTAPNLDAARAQLLVLGFREFKP